MTNITTDEGPIPDTITIELTDSNEISLPYEWMLNFGFGFGYVQITLVDDKIAIHKPTATDVKYKAPCKVGENSFIRSLSLFSVRVPKQLLRLLSINDDDKVDLTLEENCITIRKHSDDEPALPEVESPEPLLAFCCVCGSLLYTENSLIKVGLKYICHKCIELVKSL